MVNQINPQCIFIVTGLCIASANSKWIGYLPSKDLYYLLHTTARKQKTKQKNPKTKQKNPNTKTNKQIKTPTIPTIILSFCFYFLPSFYDIMQCTLELMVCIKKSYFLQMLHKHLHRTQSVALPSCLPVTFYHTCS